MTQITRCSEDTTISIAIPTSIHHHANGHVDHVFFLRGGKIWAMPTDGGEAYIVWAAVSKSIHSFKIAGKEEKYIIAEMSVVAVHGRASTNSPEGNGILFNNLMVRNWNEWDAFKERTHLFIGHLQIDCDGRVKVQYPVVDLMHKVEADCPPKGPGHSLDDYNISPNNNWLLITCKKFSNDSCSQLPDFAWSTDTPIYLADLRSVDLFRCPDDASFKPLKWRQISDLNLQSSHRNPIFSPDSENIAFLSTHQAKFESDRCRIVIYHITSKTLNNITENIDLSFQSLLWSGESGHNMIYATAQYRGSNRVFRIHLNESASQLIRIEVMKGDESRTNLQILTCDFKIFYLYYLESTLLHPNILKRLDLQRGAVDAFIDFTITTTNDLSEGEVVIESLDLSNNSMHTIMDITSGYTNGDLLLPEAYQHYYHGGNGDLIQCWYIDPLLKGEDSEQEEMFALRPASSLGDHQVPLLVIIHGGPHSASLNAWNYHWNLVAFASQGFAVLAINYHGSTGFGSDFMNSIHGDWGGKPFEDIMLGIDYILQKYSYLDPNRVAALGASYGGYMINWINGHTDRFKCLVNHAGVFSLRSQYFTTDELSFPGKYYYCPFEFCK